MVKALLMQHDEDPANQIWQQLGGKLDDIEVFGNYVLLGIYERPEKTKSGIIVTANTRKEDEHQGKSALVLKKGPTAFVSDHNYDFCGQTVEVGDWVAIFISDGRKLVIDKQLCRLVEDHHIRLKLESPDTVY